VTVIGGSALPPDRGIAHALALPAHAASAGAARAWFHSIAAATPLPSALVEDTSLVLSELVTNAVLHAGTDVHVTIRVGGVDRVHLEVGDATPELPALQAVAPDRIGGIGLQIVDQLVAAWGVRTTGPGTVVWADLGVSFA
jgi:anti-sigma regulatory factor (Ser/Thr protein kinase)